MSSVRRYMVFREMNMTLNNSEGEGGTLIDIDMLELVESLKGEAAGNL